jgi:hypothetical protein
MPSGSLPPRDSPPAGAPPASRLQAWWRSFVLAGVVALLVTVVLLLTAATTGWLDAPLDVGRRLAAGSKLYLVNADGTGRRRLTNEPGLMH